jgi:hypothetical protein
LAYRVVIEKILNKKPPAQNANKNHQQKTPKKPSNSKRAAANSLSIIRESTHLLLPNNWFCTQHEAESN